MKLVYAVRPHPHMVSDICVLPAAGLLAVAFWDGLVALLDASSGETCQTCRADPTLIKPRALDATFDGQDLFVAFGPSVVAFDLTRGLTGYLRPSLPHDWPADPIHALVTSPDTKYVLTAAANGAIHFCDRRWRPVKRAQLSGFPPAAMSVAVSPDGRWAAATGSPESTSANLMMFDTRSDSFSAGTGDLVATRELWAEGGARSLAFSPDGTYLLAGSWHSGCTLFDVRRDEPDGRRLDHSSYLVTHLSFVTGRTFVALADNYETRVLVHHIDDMDGPSTELRWGSGSALAVDRLGQRVIVGTTDGSIECYSTGRMQ